MNPFAVLGLDARPDLTDTQVRDAWRAVAAATHPDLPGGGNPGQYAAASSAYTALRTPWARSEAYADVQAAIIPASPPHDRQALDWPGRAGRAAGLLAARIRHGRPVTLAARTLLGFLLAVAVLHSGAGPAVAGTLAGIVLWLALTARGDLAPPPGR
ncbi:MAG: hypothetical protein ACR2FU_01795 [Streptosporangiaceae bacterium]